MKAKGAVLAGAALIASLAIVAIVWSGLREPTSRKTKDAEPRPTLYCEFYNFMHNATIVAFNFAVGRDAEAKPTFQELFIVEQDGTKTMFDENPPQWTYRIEDETPSIRSPDSEVRIMLYGLKAKQGGVFWTEAGIRSNDYRNLEGKCRQAHLDVAGEAATKASRSIAK